MNACPPNRQVQIVACLGQSLPAPGRRAGEQAGSRLFPTLKLSLPSQTIDKDETIVTVASYRYILLQAIVTVASYRYCCKLSLLLQAIATVDLLIIEP